MFSAHSCSLSLQGAPCPPSPLIAARVPELWYGTQPLCWEWDMPLLPPSQSCPRCLEPRRECCGQEPGGAGKAQPSTAWKTFPCSLGRPGLSLSGCQHLKGKEEEGERGDRDIVEQEGASGCHQPVVCTINNCRDAGSCSYAKQLAHPPPVLFPFLLLSSTINRALASDTFPDILDFIGK